MQTSNKGMAISAHGLTRRFGDLVAVNDLDLEVPAGGVIGFVGPNGSGKSTTIRMLLGLIKPDEGEGSVLGASIADPNAYADRVGSLVENPALVLNISARANVESMAAILSV